MADLRDLLEIGRDDDDRRARLQRDVEQPVDFRLGADVDAGGRVLEDVDLRVEVQPAPDHDLLLVAARQAARSAAPDRSGRRPTLRAELLRGAALAAGRR